MASEEPLFHPLPREQVIKALERGEPVRIPLVNAKWWGEGLFEQYGERLFEFDRYPEDATVLLIEPLDVDSMLLSWEIKAGTATTRYVSLTTGAGSTSFWKRCPTRRWTRRSVDWPVTRHRFGHRIAI
jgi:hypothetical protein